MMKMLQLLGHHDREWLAYGIYAVAALAVLLPLLRPGFVLTLDMVFTPKLPMPQDITSSYLFHAGLHMLNLLLPADVIQKLLLVSIMLLASCGTHRLIRVLLPANMPGAWSVYVASIFFAVNPFTYSRFMAGQYAVLLGYALLPWLVRAGWQLTRQPSLRHAMALGIYMTLIGIVSIHTLGLTTILLAVGLVLTWWRHPVRHGNYLRYGVIAVALTLLCSSYWLVPLATGHGRTAAIASSFTSADTDAFATLGDNLPARAWHVAHLQGFWAEGRGLYLLPQDRLIGWGLLGFIIFGLVITGTVRLWRTHPTAALFFVISGGVGLLLASGVGTPLLAPLGYREPHKFAGLVAFSYSILLVFGIQTTALAVRTKRTIFTITAATVTVVAPLFWTRVMWWGFDGQLSPRQYPADWALVNERLNRDTTDFSVLFLPWHQYMTFRFAGRVIANPAPLFFDKPVVSSPDPELGGATSGPATPQQQRVARLLQDTQHAKEFSGALARANIKYIVLAKELDYRRYEFLERESGLRVAGEYADVRMYRNEDWGGER